MQTEILAKTISIATVVVMAGIVAVSIKLSSNLDRTIAEGTKQMEEANAKHSRFMTNLFKK